MASAVSSDQLHNLHFRPLTREDWHRLQAFHNRLSASTVQSRFHGAKRELSTPLAHYFTDLDGHDRVAIVATTGTRGRIVGVARYTRISPTSAEVAFVVEDAYQGHGVGRHLMALLREHALKNGITELIADVLPENVPMFHLLREAGEARTVFQRGECVVSVDLTHPAAAVAPAPSHPVSVTGGKQ
jgi:RimJ/RimL family protein N-acetyltransferase